jgi:hypothetical protein
MLALRFAGLLALAVLLGGLVALGGFAAPASFDVLSARLPESGRTLAGLVFGEALRRFQPVIYACGFVLLCVLIARAVIGPRPIRFAIRIGIVLAVLATSLYSGFVLTPRIERLRDEAGGAPSALAAADPRRAEFGRLHGLSTVLLMVNIAGGLVLLFFEAKD